MLDDPKTDNKPSLQEYWRGFPEAPFSDTFKWVDADGFEHLLTVRGWGDKSLKEGIAKAKALITEADGKPAGKYQPAPVAPVQAPNEPKYQPIDDSGHDLPNVLTFTVERLGVTVTDGKIRVKVFGGNYTKFGINIWDEVLKASGIQIDMNNLQNVPNVAGWRADYVEEVKDGQTRRKVVRLLPPK